MSLSLAHVTPIAGTTQNRPAGMGAGHPGIRPLHRAVPPPADRAIGPADLLGAWPRAIGKREIRRCRPEEGADLDVPTTQGGGDG